LEDLGLLELLASFLENHYGDPEGPTGTDVPREILVPVQPANEEVMREWLAMLRGTKVAIRVPERGAKRKLLATVEENAREAFSQSRLKRASDFAARARALHELKDHP